MNPPETENPSAENSEDTSPVVDEVVESAAANEGDTPSDEKPTPEAAETSDSKPAEKVELPEGALERFSQEQLPDLLRRALQEKGFATLTPVQSSVVEADTHSRDLRISSQTGSGKTVAIGLALGREMLRDGARQGKDPEVLLLTPTRELATQVQRELAWLLRDVPDARVEVVTGGTSVGLERKSLARGPRIVVGTPGRVFDHLNKNGFSGEKIAHVVLDEADQMFDMGFRDELQGILELLPNRQRTHLVSATFSGDVQRIAERYQKDAVRLQGTALGAANNDIEHVAHLVGFRHRYDALINILLKAHASRTEEDTGRTLVFCRTRADVNEMTERLQGDGVKAESLSGDLAQAQRTRTLSAFRSGRVSTLVATDVAARGLDVQGIDLVVHLDPPSDPDTFTHRSGRTGRAGKKGTSVLLLPPQGRSRMERLLRAARVNPTWAPVPTADKIRKLYSKVAKRDLYAALEKEVSEDELAYAENMLQEHDAKQIIARLLAMHEVHPPCPPRDITEHFSSENRGPRRGPDRDYGGGGGRGPRGPGGPRRSGPREGGYRGAPRGPASPGAPGGGPRRKWRADGPDAGQGGHGGHGGGPGGPPKGKFRPKKRDR